MWREPSIHYRNDVTIQNENTRFAFMFILFTLFAFLATTILFVFANNSYQNQSEIFQRHFLPYSILAFISLALFLIFLIGSLVYISKSIRKLYSSSLSNPPTPLPRSILKPQLPRTSDIFYQYCQTDV
jgi:hypothetical protein